MTPIEVHGLRKTYGGVAAVDGISLSVGFRGDLRPARAERGRQEHHHRDPRGHRRRDSGDVRVLGEDPGAAGRRWRARIGIVLQTATDAADLTVRETVRHFAGYYPSSRDPDEVLSLVGLSSKAGARVRTLSGGQRRRVDVALGIIGNPSLVFLDEPTTGFDPEARRQFWALIRSLAADGTTILLTTHYLEEAAALADRLAIIAAGRVVAAGHHPPSADSLRPRRPSPGVTAPDCTRSAPTHPTPSSPRCRPTRLTCRCAGPAWKTSTST